MWVEALLNEEAEEPFLLLSNCMLLCAWEREKARLWNKCPWILSEPSRVFHSSPCLLFASILCPFKLRRP